MGESNRHVILSQFWTFPTGHTLHQQFNDIGKWLSFPEYLWCGYCTASRRSGWWRVVTIRLIIPPMFRRFKTRLWNEWDLYNPNWIGYFWWNLGSRKDADNWLITLCHGNQPLVLKHRSLNPPPKKNMDLESSRKRYPIMTTDLSDSGAG